MDCPDERLCKSIRDERVLALEKIAAYCAGKAGVGADEIQDCAMTFVEGRLAIANPDAPLPPAAWLYRCAANFAHNWRKKEQRRAAREAAFASSCEDGSRSGDGLTQDEGLPERKLVHQELRKRVARAVAKLPPGEQDLYQRCHIDGQEIEAIARDRGKTRNSVDQAVHRMRRHLRAQLERDGLTEEELRDYIATISPPPQKPRTRTLEPEEPDER